MKIGTVLAFGVGYVLGTRAGRERYGQVVAAARSASQRLEAYGAGGGFAAASAKRRQPARARQT